MSENYVNNKHFQSWSDEQRKWYFSLPPKSIIQLDNEGNFIRVWSSIPEIKKEFIKIYKKAYSVKEGVNRAIRMGVRCKGFFWMYKDDYDNWIEGKETIYAIPKIGMQKRYVMIYAYEPYNRKEIHRLDYRRYEVRAENMIFINRYENAIEASDELNISVSEIRKVANGEKILHKGYYFSYTPLNEEDDKIADIKKLDKEY